MHTFLRWLLLALALLSAGCTAQFDAAGVRQVSQLAADLTARGVNSCIAIHGSYPPFLLLEVVTATGGTKVSECRPRYESAPVAPVTP